MRFHPRIIIRARIWLALVALAVTFIIADWAWPVAISAKLYDHDQQGRLTKRVMLNGRALRYQYDRAGLLCAVSQHKVGRFTGWHYPGVTRVAYRHDLAGNVTAMSDDQGETRISYDEWNRPAEIVLPTGKQLVYSYTPWGEVRSIKLDGQTIAYTRDALGNLTEIAAGTTRVRYEHDRAADQTIRHLPNGVTTIYQFTPHGQPRLIRHHQRDGALISAFRYEFDPADRVSLIEETTPRGVAVTRYAYDLVGRLQQVTRPDSSTIAFTYDALGNRLAETDSRSGPTKTYRYNAAGQLLQAGEATYTYDAAGNLTTWQKATARKDFRYDAENRLIEVAINRQTKIQYGYDGEGNRVWRKANGRTTHYVNDLVMGLPRVLAEYAADGAPAHYLLGDTTVARRDEHGATVYLLEDHLGSTRCVVDEGGAVLARYTYAPFGAPQLEEGQAQSALLYTGEQWDAEAELLYLRARYYDPQSGRFLSPDPLPGNSAAPQTFNQYSYAENDPVNRVDPLGLRAMVKWESAADPGESYTVHTRHDTANSLSPRTANGNSGFFENLKSGKYVGTGYGEEAANFYAERYIQAQGPAKLVYGTGGVLASAWTPDTWGRTTVTLAAAGAANLAITKGPQVVQALVAKGKEMVARGYAAGSNNEPFHLDLGKYVHLGDHKKWGPHIGISTSGGPKANIHLYPDHINIGGARGVDIQYREVAQTIGKTIAVVGSAATIAQSSQPFCGGTDGPPRVGGVYFDRTAKLIGELGSITGAHFDPQSGQVLLVGEKGGAQSANSLPPIKPQYLAAALRAVYAPSAHAPGMTIDPHPQNPRGATMLVRFFGNTENSELGWLMFEADRLLKGYSVGQDNETKQPVVSSVPGYRNTLDMLWDDPRGYTPGLWSRFWLVTDPVTGRAAANGHSVVFDPIKMCVKTESMRLMGKGQLVPAVDEASHEANESRACWQDDRVVFVGATLDPHAEQFARHFTEHYEQFAAERPVYAELKQAALAVALAKWMKQQGVPPDWHWINTFAPHYTTPQTTPAAYAERSETEKTGRVTRTRRVSNFGGVNMSPALQLHEQAETKRLREQLLAGWATAKQAGRDSFNLKHNDKELTAVALPAAKERALTAYNAAIIDLPQYRADELPIERFPGLARYYNSTHNQATEFGHSWSWLLPHLEFEAMTAPDGKQQSRYLTVAGAPNTRVLVQRIVLINQFGQSERFSEHFVDQQLGRIGFKPERVNAQVRGLYPLIDGGYQLLFTDGGQASFDATGRLHAVRAAGWQAAYEYDDNGRQLRALRLIQAGREQVIRFAYDERGRVQTCTANAARVDYAYDDNGNLGSVQTAAVVNYRYNDQHMLTAISVNSELLSNDYDELGHLLRQSGAQGEQTVLNFEVSAQGKVVTTRNTAATVKRYYDSQNQLISLEDSLGARVRISYGDTGQITQVETELPTGGVESARRSADGKTVQTKDARGVRREYRFGTNGRLSQLLVNERLFANYSYDDRGWLEEVIFEGGEREKFAYDADGRLQQYGRLDLAGGSVADHPVRLVSLTDRQSQAVENLGEGNHGVIEFKDNILRIKDSLGGLTEYAYSPAGLLLSVQDSYGTLISYSYDSKARLENVRLPNGRCIMYRYASKIKQLREEITGPCREPSLSTAASRVAR